MMIVHDASAADAPRNFLHSLRGFLVVAVVLSSISSFVCAFHPASKSIRHSGYAAAGRSGIHTSTSDTNQHRGSSSKRKLLVLAAKKNKWTNFDDFCAEQETRAIAASESWIVDATGFLEPEQSSALLATLGGRADVASLSVGSYRSSGGGRRVRCIYTNPDLGYDEATADSDYVCYLKIDNVGLSQCGPWPNVFVKIGLSLETVGDVFVVSNESTVYLALAPESEKTCVRLLPKELPGTGVTVTKLSKEDMDAEMEAISDSDGIVLEDMEVQRVDRRK